jgi:hypothetical protein
VEGVCLRPRVWVERIDLGFASTVSRVLIRSFRKRELLSDRQRRTRTKKLPSERTGFDLAAVGRTRLPRLPLCAPTSQDDAGQREVLEDSPARPMCCRRNPWWRFHSLLCLPTAVRL